MCHKWALDFFFIIVIFFNTLRPPSKLVDCIVFLQRWGSWNDNSVWLQLDGTIRGGRKRVCFAIRPGLQNALMQLRSLLHILFPSSRWMYQEAALSLPPGWVMNRCGRRAPRREEELISPRKEAPSISSWFPRRCTRVALRRAFSQTDRPLTSPLIFLTHAQECKSSAHGCSSRRGDFPSFPMMFYYFFFFWLYKCSLHFVIQSGCLVPFWQAPAVVGVRRLSRRIQLELSFACTRLRKFRFAQDTAEHLQTVFLELCKICKSKYRLNLIVPVKMVVT